VLSHWTVPPDATRKTASASPPSPSSQAPEPRSKRTFPPSKVPVTEIGAESDELFGGLEYVDVRNASSSSFTYNARRESARRSAFLEGWRIFVNANVDIALEHAVINGWCRYRRRRERVGADDASDCSEKGEREVHVESKVDVVERSECAGRVQRRILVSTSLPDFYTSKGRYL